MEKYDDTFNPALLENEYLTNEILFNHPKVFRCVYDNNVRYFTYSANISDAKETILCIVDDFNEEKCYCPICRMDRYITANVSHLCRIWLIDVSTDYKPYITTCYDKNTGS